MGRKAISKQLRLKLKEKYNGKCGYCEIQLKDKFHIDHIKPHFNGGSCDEDNLMAVCVSCNLQKGGRSLECFRDLVEDKPNQLKLVANYEVAKRYGMIIEIPKKIVFYFERMKDKVVI